MGVNSTEAFRRSRPRFQRFRFAIAGRRICYERIEELLCNSRHVINSVVECVFVGLGRLGESAQLSDELMGRRANFVVRRGRCKIMQGLDVSAHA